MDKKPRSFKEAWVAYKQTKQPNSPTYGGLSYTYKSFSRVLYLIFDHHESKVSSNNFKNLAQAMELSSALLISAEAQICSLGLSKNKSDYFSKFNLRNLEKFSIALSSFIFLFRSSFQISLPIIFNTIRNFTIQKNLSISA